MARHLDSGQIGLAPRNRGVIDSTSEEQTVKTTLHNLPLEVVDIILQKSYLHWILNSPTKQIDEEVIRSLTSVDVCFYRRITRKRWKKSIWSYLTYFYGKTKKINAIVRNNRDYFLENIQPSDNFIASLLSFNCITEEQSRCIQRQRSIRQKNDKLLYTMKLFDKTKLSNFVKCLRRTNQQTVARIIENGGGTIKFVVKTRDANCSTSMETQQFHKQIEDLRSKAKPWSLQTNKLMSQLMEKGIEILNSDLEREAVVVWLWYHSQAALQHIQKLHESTQLIDTLFTNNIESQKSVMVSMQLNQFKKTVVVCPLSSNFTQRIETPERLYGMAKLRNNIYIITQRYSYNSSVIKVFEDQNPFRFLREVKMERIELPQDMVSSEKGNCLFVSDLMHLKYRVWKITRETDDQYRIIKWITTDYKPSNMSVSSNGHLLVSNRSSSNLTIYGSDAKLLRSIILTREIENIVHAVETSIGNLIVIHKWFEKMEESDSSERSRKQMSAVCELTGDGQTVVRRFIPSNETQQLIAPSYLSLDSDDQVFVADFASDNVSHRVILLDQDLNWNRVLRATKFKEEAKPGDTLRLCYEEDKNQLIVYTYIGYGANVFTLNRN